MSVAGKTPKGVARREEIVASALVQLGSGGYRASSLRSIARELGVEPAHILYYFDSREQLLQAVIQRWDEGSQTRRGEPIPPLEALDAWVSRIRYNMQIPGILYLYLTIAAEAIHPDHSAHDFFTNRIRGVREALEEAIGAEQQIGRISPRLDGEVEARKLAAISDGLQLQALMSPDFDPASDLQDAIVALRGAGGPES